MRESMLVPAEALIQVNDLPPETVCLVEMLSIGAHAVRRAGLELTDTVLVIGGGPVGLSVLSFARPRAARIAVAEVSAARLAFLQHVGLADAVIVVRSAPAENERARTGSKAAQDTAERAVRAHFGGELPTVVVDATGNARSMQEAPRLLANGGRLVLVGHTRGILSFDNPTLHTRELAILGSRNATRDDFDEVLAALRSRQVGPSRWITHRVGPDALVQQLPGWVGGKSDVVKALVEFGA